MLEATISEGRCQVLITKVSTHVLPDIDEVVGFVLLRMFGEARFPGVSEVTTLSERADSASPDCDGLKALINGEIMLGIGGHVFDEHPRVGGLNGNKGKPGECAATLVAKFLSIADDPSLAKLLDFVLLNDQQGQGQMTSIGVLPKTMFGVYPSERVVAWMATAVHAVITAERYMFSRERPYDPKHGALVFDRGFAAWMRNVFGSKEEGAIPNSELANFVFGTEQFIATETIKRLRVDEDPSMKTLLKFFDTRLGIGDEFTLKGIPALINAETGNGRLAIDWLFDGLNAVYKDCCSFTEAVEEFHKKVEIREVVGPGKRTLRVAIVADCCNRLINKAARSLGMDVIIQQQEAGHVQIFTNKKSGLDIGDLVAMIRLAEQKAAGSVVTWDWQALRAEGAVPGAEKWFYHLAGQMMLNQTPKVAQPATRLALDDIVYYAEIALNPQRFKCQGTSCNRQCPWYELGFKRCAGVRWRQRNAQK